MSDSLKIGFIGAGNMAEALIKGFVSSGLCAAENISAFDASSDRLKFMADTYGINLLNSNDELIKQADYIVLAVKPQVMQGVLSELEIIESDKVFVSIAAGITISKLSEWLKGHQKIVRVMPNTPALIGAGVAGVSSSTAVSDEEQNQVLELFKSVGIAIKVEESMIDSVTAISGSGPAYVFYFIEQLQAAAQELGFNEAQAKELALHTFKGAAELAIDSLDSPGELRQKVTSKGGTTEAALDEMLKLKVGELFIAGVKKAHKRSIELSESL